MGSTINPCQKSNVRAEQSSRSQTKVLSGGNATARRLASTGSESVRAASPTNSSKRTRPRSRRATRHGTQDWLEQVFASQTAGAYPEVSAVGDRLNSRARRRLIAETASGRETRLVTSRSMGGYTEGWESRLVVPIAVLKKVGLNGLIEVMNTDARKKIGSTFVRSAISDMTRIRGVKQQNYGV